MPTTNYIKALVLSFCVLVNLQTQAHDASATYVANEAVLVINGDKKVLFDPFFHKAFGIYQLVPQSTKQAIFAGKTPFDNITAIVISHAHADHFAADDVLRYLKDYPNTKLVGPSQAINELRALKGAQLVEDQLKGIHLGFNDAPKSVEVAGLLIEAVRIPHAGWPNRADIENMVFRVTLQDPKLPLTVMHMGDADPDYDHYLPYKEHWQARKTHTNFPPYWFYYSLEGKDIIDSLLNTQHSIGVHVPVKVPKELIDTGEDFFSKPGESRILKHEHK